LEGGFDDDGTFLFIPFSGLQSMVEVFRRRVIKLLVGQEVPIEAFARNLLSWSHSGFSQEAIGLYVESKPSRCYVVSYTKIRMTATRCEYQTGVKKCCTSDTLFFSRVGSHPQDNRRPGSCSIAASFNPR